MSDKIPIPALRDLDVVAPDDHSVTRFAPFVSMPPEVRDALVEAVEFLNEVMPSSDGKHEILLTPEQTQRGKRIIARFVFGGDK